MDRISVRVIITALLMLLFAPLGASAQKAGQKTAQGVAVEKKATDAAKHDSPSAASIATAARDTMQPSAQDTALTAAADTAGMAADLEGIDDEEPQSFHQMLKTKFIEGSAGFMSLVALALVLGLAFCIERIIFLTLSEIDARRMLADIDACLSAGNLAEARQHCEEERGPVAAICRKALSRIGEPIDNIERGIASYGSVEAAALEKGCSWIKLFIAIAPSLGFLGTVIGMVMAFEQIQDAGDISPTIVASGMKVALITTIFGIIAALVLQVFYNYIVTKIDCLTADMEESAITLLDSIGKYKNLRG